MPKSCGGDCLAAPCAFCDGQPFGDRAETARKPRRKPGEAGYYRGVVDALRVLYAFHGCINTEYRTLANHFPQAELLHSARRTGSMRASGLSDYAKSQSQQDSREKP